MPQLDSSFFFSQICWFLLSFGAFFCVVKFLLLPRLEGIINNRKELIDNNVQFAEDVMKKVEKITDENNRKIEEVKIKNSEKIDNFINQLEKKNNDELAKIIKQNNEDIQRHLLQEKTKIIAMEEEIRQAIVEISKDILKNVYSIDNINEDDLKRNCKKSFVLKQE